MWPGKLAEWPTETRTQTNLFTLIGIRLMNLGFYLTWGSVWWKWPSPVVNLANSWCYLSRAPVHFVLTGFPVPWVPCEICSTGSSQLLCAYKKLMRFVLRVARSHSWRCDPSMLVNKILFLRFAWETASWCILYSGMAVTYATCYIL